MQKELKKKCRRAFQFSMLCFYANFPNINIPHNHLRRIPKLFHLKTRKIRLEFPPQVKMPLLHLLIIFSILFNV